VTFQDHSPFEISSYFSFENWLPQYLLCWYFEMWKSERLQSWESVLLSFDRTNVILFLHHYLKCSLLFFMAHLNYFVQAKHIAMGDRHFSEEICLRDCSPLVLSCLVLSWKSSSMFHLLRKWDNFNKRTGALSRIGVLASTSFGSSSIRSLSSEHPFHIRTQHVNEVKKKTNSPRKRFESS
jgi:hypothetical protein